MLIYLLKTFLIQLIGLTIYYFFLRNEKLFIYARNFIWLVISGSFIIPLISIPAYFSNQAIPNLDVPTIYLTPQEIAIPVTQTTDIGMTEVAYIVCILITLALLSRLFVSYIKLINIKKRSEFERPNLYFSKEVQTPYSFLTGIYIPLDLKKDTTLPLIIAHENEHISRRHSFDKIAISLMACLFWFNPLFRIFHKELELIHEYQVDETVIQSFSKEEYLSSLLSSSVYLTSSAIPLTHSFFSSPLKQRIIMLHKKEKYKNLRRVATICLLLLSVITVVVFQSQDVLAQKNKSEVSDDNKTEFIRNEDGTYTKTVTDKNGKETKTIVKEAEFLRIMNRNSGQTGTWSVDEDGVLNLKRTLNGDAGDALTRNQSDEITENVELDFGGRGSVSEFDMETGTTKITLKEEPSAELDKYATFPGGSKAMVNYLSKNLKYPKSDKNQNKSGEVYIEFVIDHMGNISNAKALQVPNGMDAHAASAIKVIEGMPAWTPAEKDGKKVKTSMVLPIRFEKEMKSKRDNPKEGYLYDKKLNRHVWKSSENDVDYSSIKKLKDPLDLDKLYRRNEDNVILTKIDGVVHGIHLPDYNNAEFPGGQKALFAYIGKELKFSKEERKSIPKGTLFVEIEISKTGKILGSKAVKVPDGMEILEKKAIVAVKKMPQWKPAEKDGKKVKSSYILPISFRPEK